MTAVFGSSGYAARDVLPADDAAALQQRLGSQDLQNISGGKFSQREPEPVLWETLNKSRGLFRQDYLLFKGSLQIPKSIFSHLVLAVSADSFSCIWRSFQIYIGSRTRNYNF